MLAAMPDRTAVRRLIAIVCAFAFLTLGFTHTLHDCDGRATFAVSSLDAGMPDDSPDLPKKTAAAVDHCCSCATVAMPAADTVMPLLFVAVARAWPAADSMWPHPPTLDLRPPITAT